MNARPHRPSRRGDGRLPPAVAVIGEALVDRHGDSRRPGGAPFNLARSLAALGVPTTFISRIGRDADGERLRAEARRFGLDDRGLQEDPARPTGVAEVLARDDDHGFRIHAGAAWEAIDEAPALAALRRRPVSALVYGTLAQRGAVTRQTWRRLLQDSDALRLVDLNLRAGFDNRVLASEALAGADWAKVNEEELGHLLVWFVPTADAAAPHGSRERQQGIAQLAQRFGLQKLVVTRGAHGYACHDAQGRLVAAGPGVPVAQVADTVGAGAAFCAALLALVLAGEPWPRALHQANRYAGAVCAEPGAVPDDDEFFVAWRWTLGLGPPWRCMA